MILILFCLSAVYRISNVIIVHFNAGLKDETYRNPIFRPDGLVCRLTGLIQRERDNNYQYWTWDSKGNMTVASLLTVLESQLLTVLLTISISIVLGRIRGRLEVFL